MNMTDKNARTLSQPSNRAKPKDNKEKKVVFKGVLDSPFRIQWPSVPINLQNSILACLLELLKGASEVHHKRCAVNRKRKREFKDSEISSRKKKTQKTDALDPMDISESSIIVPKFNDDAPTELDSSILNQDPPIDIEEEGRDDSPILMRHILYGINAVTKRLEIQAQNARRPTIISLPESTEPPPKFLRYVFVCRADVDPALLISHFPHLVAAYNSTRPAQPIKLVPLPKGSEFALAQILGIRRVAVLAVDVDYSDDTMLKTMLEPLPILAASWLTQSNSIPSLIPTHIKHVKTTAPKDMKEAKEERVLGKRLAKKKKLAQKFVMSTSLT